MYLIRHKNLKTVRLGVWESYNDICTNLAETTQADNNSSEHVTARNIGCLDPFSDLYAEVISACWPTVIIGYLVGSMVVMVEGPLARVYLDLGG